MSPSDLIRWGWSRRHLGRCVVLRRVR